MRGIIFDMDGVLFATEAIWQKCFNKAARERGLVLDDSFRKEVGGSNGEHMRQTVRKHFHTSDPDSIIKQVYGYVDDELAKNLPEKPGLHEILADLKEKGYHIAVASASPHSTIESNLQRSNVRDYFEVILSGEEVEHSKPDPDIFIKAAEKLGIPNEECYVIEDAYNGVKAGTAAGSKVIMVIDTQIPNEQISSLCYKVCNSLLEVIPYIEKSSC